MSTTAGTMVINGQQYPVATASALRPAPATGTTYYGRGSAPQTIPAAPGAPTNNGAVLQAAASPFSFAKSPVPLLLIMLVVGVAGLRYIHWRH